MNQLKLLVTFVCVSYIWGCAVTSEYQLAEYEKLSERDKLPVVSLFTYRGSDEFVEECRVYDSQSSLHHCDDALFSLNDMKLSLIEANVFKDVLYADRQNGYRITISPKVYNTEGGEELSNAVAAGATLLLAPMVVNANLKAEVYIFWHRNLLKKYEYDIPFKTKMNLFSMNQDVNRGLSDSLATHMVSDFQKDNVFSRVFLSEELSSVNYEKEYKAAEFEKKYIHDGDHIFEHPFLGVQSRYFFEENKSDYIDVFVYPIHHWDLSSQSELIKKGIKQNKNDLEHSSKERKLQGLVFLEDSEVEILIEKDVLQSAYLKAGYRDTNELDYITETYLVISKDKFIKFRASYPNYGEVLPDLKRFVKSYLSKAVIPDESLFMSRVRKQWMDERGLMD